MFSFQTSSRGPQAATILPCRRGSQSPLKANVLPLVETPPLSLRLASSRSAPINFESRPVCRLQSAHHRLRVVGGCSWSQEEADPTPAIVSRGAVFGTDEEQSTDLASVHGPANQGAVAAQAERQDHDLVLLAAYKLAYAERDVDALLNWGGTAWKRAALARCIAKGWIAVRVDAVGAMRTFCVTLDGYRAADLRAPLLSC